MAKKNSPDNHKKLLSIFSAIYFIIVLLSFTVLNPPQCPLEYTQAQVDATGCNVGANIGLGLMAMFVLVPGAVILLVLWAQYLSKTSKTGQKK